MKSLILGIMIASVSMSFAQSDNGSTHQLKQRVKAKRMMTVQPVAVNVKDNSEPIAVKSREEVKSSVVNGVVRVKNGTPFIDVENGRLHRKLVPENFTKAMLRDLEGKEIQFRYTVSDHSLPKQGEYSMMVNLHDVAIVKKR